MMKKNVHLLFLGLVLLLGACSKDKQDAPVKGKRIAAVFVDDILLERYHYQPDGKLDRYSTQQPDGSVENTWHYSYDAAGVLSTVKSFKDDGSPYTEQVFMKDASGRIVRSRFINHGIFAQDSEYEYDNAVPARVIRARDYDTTGNPTLVREFTWNEGVQTSCKVFEVNGAALELLSESYFSNVADAGVLDKHRETVSSLTHPIPDNWLVYAVSSGVTSKNYAGGVLSYDRVNECLSRVTDEKKYTLSVQYKSQFIVPALPDKLSTYRYEYIEL